MNYRFALAAAYFSYFRSLKDVGDLLRKFVEEELVNSPFSSSVSSPSLILPATSKMKNNYVGELGLHGNEDEVESHLNLSVSSDDDDDDGDSEYHNHNYSHDHHRRSLDSDDNHQLNQRRVHEQKGNDFDYEDEERILVKYEKQCKRLKILDEVGAEATKLDAAQASIRRSRTKLDVSVKAIDGISSRIHELRDEELQPQVAALIHGFIRTWKAMLKFHQKQFQAIMESRKADA